MLGTVTSVAGSVLSAALRNLFSSASTYIYITAHFAWLLPSSRSVLFISQHDTTILTFITVGIVLFQVGIVSLLTALSHTFELTWFIFKLSALYQLRRALPFMCASTFQGSIYVSD